MTNLQKRNQNRVKHPKIAKLDRNLRLKIIHIKKRQKRMNCIKQKMRVKNNKKIQIPAPNQRNKP